MHKRQLRKIFVAILALSLILTVIPTAYAADSNGGNGKIINVVYDDSGSMVRSGERNIERWSQAKYAMEVFCAMMDSTDVMNIFPMSLSGDIGLTLSGSDPNRVAAVHDMNGQYRNTPFSTVTAAAKHLLESDNSYEKWLVIITDGAFDDGATPASKVQSTIDGYNDQGIKTVYLAIGNSASMLEADASRGAYAEKAADGSEVPAKVTAIANQIFEHQVLGNKFISQSGNNTVLNIDIPTNQIIVFAQGDEVTVGNLSLNGRAISATSIENVKWSDVKPTNYANAPVDTTLKGVVATFNSGNTPFESGQFELIVSNASTVEYYYRPGVTVNCDLLYAGQKAQQNDELFAGDYEIALSFVNPLNGQEVQSELLSSAIFSLTAKNNEQVKTVTEKKGKVELEQGEVVITATAELPGHVYLTNSKTYSVLPAPKVLLLSFEPDNPLYTRSSISRGTDEPIIMRAVDAENGDKLTEEDWKNTEVTVSEANGISWQAKRGKEIGTWELWPQGEEKKITTGDAVFDVSAAFSVGSQFSHGASSFGISVTEYINSGLRVEIDVPQGGYDLNDMENPEGMIVTVYVENSDTGEYSLLSEEQWRAIELSLETDKKIAWDIQRSDEIAKWVAIPQYYHGDPLVTDSGRTKVTVTASGVVGDHLYEGSASESTNFESLSQYNRLKYLLPRIAMACGVVAILLGYLLKKKLKLRGLKPTCSQKKNSVRRSIKKVGWRKILPFFSEQAMIYCHYSELDCNFPNLKIEAVRRGTAFRIVNYKNIKLDSTLIDGERYETAKELKKAIFYLPGFTMVSLNQYGKETGKFEIE